MTTGTGWLRVAAALGVVAGVLLRLPEAEGALSFAERLTEKRLAALRAGVEALRRQERIPGPPGAFEDVRCVLHAHSSLSHDSRGTPEQLVAAAAAAGVKAVFMTEHPTPDRRWWTEGLRGRRNGVLFIPGAELSDGLLLWRTDGTRWKPDMRVVELLPLLEPGALSFIAHPEQRKTDAAWELPPFTGMEIYNTHADAEDSRAEGFLEQLRGRNPLQLLRELTVLRRYAAEAFASIFDEPTEILARWDRLNAAAANGGRAAVGIAGNDSHQNVGIAMQVEANGIRVQDALGKDVGFVPRRRIPALLLPTLKPGTTLLSHVFDPYEISFGYVSTHLLAPEASEDALFAALVAGRAYVAFDWMSDPTGFVFRAVAGERVHEMGERLPLDRMPRIEIHSPLPATLRLLRDGTLIREGTGRQLIWEVDRAGAYRAEVWVDLGQERRPWIYSNPVYILP